VKIRALENFFSIKIFQKREQEIKQLIKNISALAVAGLCDWSVPNCNNLILILGFSVMKFLQIITFSVFTSLIQTMSTINNACYYVMSTILFWVELRVSIKRVEMFFNLEELENLQLKDSESEAATYKRIQLGEKVISIKNGEFCWEINPDKSRQSQSDNESRGSATFDGLTNAMDSTIEKF
jgi:hypothetical protein